MSLANLLADNIVISDEENLTVDKALDITCLTLIEQGKIEKSYAEAIKAKHKEIGPYYILAPKIAMPHAHPEDGVNEACLQLTVFKHGVDLESGHNENVYFFITLAAQDTNNHIRTIITLSELFQNEKDVNAIITANNKEEIIEILEKYS